MKDDSLGQLILGKEPGGSRVPSRDVNLAPEAHYLFSIEGSRPWEERGLLDPPPAFVMF